MVATNTKFRKKFLTVLEKASTANIFHKLAKSGSSPQFVSQAANSTPILVHTVGFYPQTAEL